MLRYGKEEGEGLHTVTVPLLLSSAQLSVYGPYGRTAVALWRSHRKDLRVCAPFFSDWIGEPYGTRINSPASSFNTVPIELFPVLSVLCAFNTE